MWTDTKVDVYLIKDDESGFYKIGYAKCARKRLKALLKQEPLLPKPFQFWLVNKWYVPQSFETRLHERFADRRIRGEWFELTDADVEWLHDYMDQFDEGFPKYREHPDGMSIREAVAYV